MSMRVKMDNVFVVIFLLVVVLPSAVLAQQEDRGATWGISAGTTTAPWHSGTLADKISQSLGGLDLEVSGGTWDVMAARGRPGSSEFRVGFARVNFDRNGRAFDNSTEYLTHENVRMSGLKAEYIWRLGSADWPVAPMISVYGCGCHISGTVTRLRTIQMFNQSTRTMERIQASPEDRPVEDLFDGRTWIPIVGTKVGLITAVPYGTVRVTVFGTDLLGAHFGAIEYSFWPGRR